jgi:predicted dehydrogenase
MPLTAVVIGSGWAAEGHTIALQSAGATVVAICGRNQQSVVAKAIKHGIPNTRLDWRQALEEFRPDIVSITVPAGPHKEMSELAARMRIPTVCEKPLSTNAKDASEMLAAFEQAGVKHCYAPSSWYSPAVLYARTLVAEGLIGHVCEIESLVHLNFSPMMAFPGWAYDADSGGGLLNLVFTHKIAQILQITQSRVVAAAGETRRLFERAPVAREVHDFREAFSPTSVTSEDEARSLPWRTVTADTGYSVLLRVITPEGLETSALFQATAMAGPFPEALVLYGTKGSLSLTGPNSPDRIQHFDQRRGSWQDIPIPEIVLRSLPSVQDPVQRDWNQLYHDFVADLLGNEHEAYPTFKMGVLTAQIIDVARKNQSLTPIVS